MRTLLDDVIDATTGGPTIVSEQHDTGSINWIAGLSDPGELIGCGEYQQLRRHAGEQDAPYAARLRVLMMTIPAEDRAKIETAMKGGAIRRAGLDTTGGRVAVMVAGEPAWHGLGVQVDRAVNSADAVRLAGLGWTVDKVKLSYTDPAGLTRTAPDVFGIVRQDSGEMLGSVGNRYQPIQNADGFGFLDSVLGRFGAKYQTAGSVYGGKRVWMLVDLPAQSFAVGGRDRVKAYAIFTNTHDGSGAAKCYPTSERVVCANTLRVSLKDKGHGVSIRHSGEIRQKVKDAERALGLTVQGFEQFKEQADVLARTPVPEPVQFFDGLLDLVCDVTAAEAKAGASVLAAVLAVDEAERRHKAKQIQREIDRRGSLLEDILERYHSERCGTNGMRGTAWAALNAVTEHADHSKLIRYTGSPEARASRRFESVIDGPADELKQAAFSQALALAN